MTTFQDPPPQSRRAVRQSERGEHASEGSPIAPSEAVPYSFDDVSSAGETSAQAPVDGSPSSEGAHAVQQSGRRAQLRVGPPVDAQASQSLANQPPPSSFGETAEQAAFRLRDFSPEGRRSAGIRDQSGPASPAASFAPPARPVELDYQTQAVAPGSHVAAPAPLDDSLNHTLSRRELRQMRAAEEAAAPALQAPPMSGERPEPINALLNSGPIDIPTLAPPPGQSQALAEAMAEFDLLTRSRREAEARARDAQVASLATPIIPQVQAAPSIPLEAAPVQAASIEAPPVQVAPQGPVPQLPFGLASAPQVPEQASPALPAPVPVPSVPAPIVEQPPMLLTPTFSDQAPQAEIVVPQAPPAETGPVDEQNQHGGRSPRASGHWRVQAAIEDDELPYENTLSRTVGSNTSAITTSALVLPSVPSPDAILNNLTSTGEILVTGTIDLPRSLGSTGAHPSRIDNSDFEDDPLDSQVAAPDSAPIRAIRAVSTNTSTRGVIETKKPNGTRVLTAVIIVASVLCVSLVGLLVFAFATNKL